MVSRYRVLILVAAVLSAGVLVAGCMGDSGSSHPPVSTPTGLPTPVKPTVTRTVAVTTLPATTIPPPATTGPAVPAGTIIQAGSALRILGPVYGMKAKAGTFLDLITFDLEKDPRADPVDMETVQITLTRYARTTALNYAISDQKNADGDGILENGETFGITVYVKPDFSLYPGDQFELRVLVPGSAPILLQSRVPSSLEERNLLAGS
jgi:hypothetical protein